MPRSTSRPPPAANIGPTQANGTRDITSIRTPKSDSESPRVQFCQRNHHWPGLRALYKPGQWWLRWQNWTRGLSLSLLGVLMLVISRVPFVWVGPMLAAGGGLLVLRGMIGAFLIFRPR